MDIKELTQSVFNKDTFISATLSNPKEKGYYKKLEIKLINIKLTNVYQFIYYSDTQVFHKNLSLNETIKTFNEEILNNYKNGVIFTTLNDYNLFSNRLKEVSIKKLKPSKIKITQENNRKKNYILPEDTFIPFLYELGIVSEEGKMHNSKYSKFKQVNRYLEFIDDIIDTFNKDEVINIVDFGCGKSYLTFATHYYFKEIKKLNVNIIGLDLKKDVIRDCNKIVEKYNLEGIKFLTGDIKDYISNEKVDMVISLHACDTATDYALNQAINWKSKVIFAVPCCQHEVNKEMKPKTLSAISDYGLIQERIASLLTDLSRAELLKSQGYKTQILEFIDLEHTPKNILIRAVLTNNKDNEALTKLNELKNEFNYSLTLEKLLNK